MKKKRSESFFGLHFDFHANTECDCIGENTTPEMIQTIIDDVRPDFMQCDCKGHPGYASYGTKLGNAAPGLKKDALKVWRKVTEDNDIPLYMHYSGVIDTFAAKLHPEWATKNPDGSLVIESERFHTMSFFSDYTDKYLIPQIEELYNDYGVDGLWIDGECWGVNPDYSEAAKAAYKAKTGKEAPPLDENGKAPKEYIDFFREEFLNYLNHYLDKLHKSCPNLDITSNWAFSTYIPQAVCADVDYLSADLTPVGAVGSARHESRYLSKQGKPWDLMSWAFTQSGGMTTKSSTALCQEAAAVISQGGGFQIYYIQNRDGSVNTDWVKTAAPVAKFCREREAYCHNWKSIPQVAVLLSTEGSYHAEKDALRFWGTAQKECKGILECAIESGFVVDLVSEHHLKDTINDYAAIIVPEWDVIGNHDELVKYAENGGGLIIIGKPAKLFEKELGVKLGEFKEYTRLPKNGDLTAYNVFNNLTIAKDGVEAGIPENHLYDVEIVSEDTKPFMDYLTNGKLMSTIRNIGKGKIAAIYMDFGIQYKKNKSPLIREVLKTAINSVTDKLRLNVTGSSYVEVSLNEKDGKTAINLINTGGPGGDPTVASFDEIPPIGPLKVSFKTDKVPSKVTLMPQNKPLKFTYENGIMETSVDRLEIYDIIIVE